jgi:hypothetical protein
MSKPMTSHRSRRRTIQVNWPSQDLTNLSKGKSLKQMPIPPAQSEQKPIPINEQKPAAGMQNTAQPQGGIFANVFNVVKNMVYGGHNPIPANQAAAPAVPETTAQTTAAPAVPETTAQASTPSVHTTKASSSSSDQVSSMRQQSSVSSPSSFTDESSIHTAEMSSMNQNNINHNTTVLSDRLGNSVNARKIWNMLPNKNGMLLR